MAEEVGLLAADKVKVYRLKNWVNVVKQTEKILNEANLPPSAVPPRMFLPILEASSLEDNETLQSLWAGLLASASDKADSLSPCFIETLKQLTPNEAKAINRLFDSSQMFDHQLGGPEDLRYPFPEMEEIALKLMTETFERIGLIRRQYDLREQTPTLFFSSYKVSTNFLFGGDKDKLPQLTYILEFTEYGIQFMKACRGPSRKEGQVTPEADT
jgi:hypothetical protein